MGRGMSDQIFNLPDLGEGLTEAEVVRWLVADGDVVDVDQPVVEVETAKSLVEVPSPFAGVIAVRHAPEGATVDVGKPLLTVRPVPSAPSSPSSPSLATSPSSLSLPTSSSSSSSPADVYREEERAGSGNVLIGYGTAAVAASGRRRRPRNGAVTVVPASGSGVPLVSSPLVRRLARLNEVDLRTVKPSGAGGVIVRADIERVLPVSAPAAAAAASPAPALGGSSKAAAGDKFPPLSTVGEKRIPLSGFRKAASAALSRSRAEIPEATVWVDVDFTALWQLRESLPAGPGLMAYLSRFVVAGLRQYPVLNARLDVDRQEIVQLDRVDLGIAVQGERGLVVPAVRGASTMTTSELDSAIRQVVADARAGRVSGEGTFTLNNYGAFRVDGSAAIINHPQVAILGFGRIIDRAWVVAGELCVRKVAQMSFVFDHRVCDGGTAAGFMRAVADAIENPAHAIAQL
ncbi:dihydrolipoamide acetyltransferase family protein [Actinoplanes sp. NPDC051343]|uniref:dihydrolipoamide acetyltransferase family protein n=1 Tax=Actinoplanes sp. NPDC051343 TaxID=3363906 RepID=UPI0037B91577